ncbi:MAG: polysaccharide deacetylase family protein [Deltaproteobacteria bacterium]|nr:polysaccharide deacetylase family protein [Deltaproteobacteria bacterium]
MSTREPLRSRLRNWILITASRLGYFRIFAFFNRHKINILYYHGVSAREAFPGIENYQGKHVRASLFWRHLAFLARRYNILPLPDVLHAMKNGVPLPPYTAVITFDDGYENNATVALPSLLDAGLTASFFLTTDLIGTDECLWVDQLEMVLNDDQRMKMFVRFGTTRETVPLETAADRREDDRLVRWFCKQLTEAEKSEWLRAFFAENGIDAPKARGDHRFMSWDQARELHARGMTVGSHTLTHAIITRLTPSEMEREIGEAKAACEARLKVRCDTFAYPNGRLGDFSKASTDVLRRLGITCGLTTIHGLNGRDANVYTMKRIGVGDRTSLEELEAHLSGLTGFAIRLRRTLFG